MSLSFGRVRATMLYLTLGMRISLICQLATCRTNMHVATGWPNARNMLRPTMLRSDAFKCCDRLAGACKCCDNNVGICCVEMLLSFGRGFIFIAFTAFKGGTRYIADGDTKNVVIHFRLS